MGLHRTGIVPPTCAVLAWSSLANGFFSGRLTRDNFEEAEEIVGETCARAYGSEANLERLERARLLAEERGKTIPQIALAWALHQPLNLFPLVGSRSGEEFRENREALEIELTSEELGWLDLKAER